MEREVPRTVRSLSQPYQRGIQDLNFEIVVVDNGSAEPLDASAIEAIAPNVRVVRYDAEGVSPASAVNRAVAATTGRLVGIVLDGARMVTPGILTSAMEALAIDDHAMVTPLAWHLGPQHQTLSLRDGYSREMEDALLAEIHWPDDGYRLFDIAALAAANPTGWFGRVNESCCTFLSRVSFDDLGGYDEAFTTPGGGYVNLDFFTRAVSRPEGRLCILLGEGSFHQIHGGVATNARDPDAVNREFMVEYENVRGRPYEYPEISPYYLGYLAPALKTWVSVSSEALEEQMAATSAALTALQKMKSSRTWRLTAPLRHAGRRIQRFRRP